MPRVIRPRPRPPALALVRRLACMVAGVAGIAAAACGAVDLGSHSTTSDGGADANATTSDGATAPVGAACGSRGLPACAAGLYCFHDITTQCGALDAPGTCAEAPSTCPSDVVPTVCGCDGITYASACAAAAARVSVHHGGACVPGDDGGVDADGGGCGARGLGACPEPQVCIYPLSASCGELDRPGTCRTVSAASACPSVFDPVCGCNGQTYQNECRANNAGTSVRALGDCP